MEPYCKLLFVKKLDIFSNLGGKIMKTETLTTRVLIADEGKILTDGKAYGRTIYLAKNRSPEEFHEISEAEYGEIMKQNEEAMENE